jgi:PAS domain S-box-containing protein
MGSNPLINPVSDPLFSPNIWRIALEKYASAVHLTVRLFDTDGGATFGPIHPTPLFQLFDEAGYDPGIFAECARRCVAQTDKRGAVLISQYHGLTVVGASLVLEGRTVGAAVTGYAFADFSQVSEIQRLAHQAGIAFERLWDIARKQPPVPRQRLAVQGELLQVLGDALLRENYRTRQHEQAAAIVNSSGDAIIGIDLNGTIVSWNDAAQRLYGYTPEEIIGKPVAVLIPPDRLEEGPGILERIHIGEKVDHYDTVRRHKDGTAVDISLTVSPVRDAEGNVVGASKIARDITDRKRAEAHRDLLIGEMSHRVKNVLTTVQSIASLTLQQSASMEAFKPAFNGRLLALAQAHDLLMDEGWAGTEIGQLVDQILEPHRAVGRTRIMTNGPRITLPPQAGVALIMILHELATNATKYGSLSVPNGTLGVTWRRDDSGSRPQICLRWIESSGPRVKAPSRRGFGTRLIERSMIHELHGEARLDYREDGFHADLTFPWELSNRA